MTDDGPLQRGELLWITTPAKMRDGEVVLPERTELWCVARAGKTVATIVRHTERVEIEARLRCRDGRPVAGSETVRRLNTAGVEAAIRRVLADRTERPQPQSGGGQGSGTKTTFGGGDAYDG